MSRRSPCDGSPASDWRWLRLAQGQSCPYLSERAPPDGQLKPVDGLLDYSNHSDLGKEESDGRDPSQLVAPHAHKSVVAALYASGLSQPSLPEYQLIRHSQAAASQVFGEARVVQSPF